MTADWLDVNTACFLLFGLLFTGYLVLEGFDYGAGMLLPFFGAAARRAIVGTLAPVWEGNEVWLIAAGTLLFAGFPVVYATLFSGLYPALLLLLLALVLRGVAFELADKDARPVWRRFWEGAIFAGSALPPFVWGVTVAGLAGGLPIDAGGRYAGNFGAVLTPFTLTGGAAFVAVFLIHGATYLALRLDARLVPEVRARGLRAGGWALALATGFAGLGLVYTDMAARPLAIGLLVSAAAALVLARRCLGGRRYGRSFLLSSGTIVLLAAAVFAGLFPRLAVSSLDPAWSLTVYNAASGPLTLRIMAWTVAAALPVVMAFEVWKYRVFRCRVPVGGPARRLAWQELCGQLRAASGHGRRLAATMEALLRLLRR
jgi:cytochrome d ubiquinol oxidase subunit II